MQPDGCVANSTRQLSHSLSVVRRAVQSSARLPAYTASTHTHTHTHSDGCCCYTPAPGRPACAQANKRLPMQPSTTAACPPARRLTAMLLIRATDCCAQSVTSHHPPPAETASEQNGPGKVRLTGRRPTAGGHTKPMA